MSMRAAALLAVLALAACAPDRGGDSSFTPRINGYYGAFGGVVTTR